MKKILLMLILLLAFSACNANTETEAARAFRAVSEGGEWRMRG